MPYFFSEKNFSVNVRLTLTVNDQAAKNTSEIRNDGLLDIYDDEVPSQDLGFHRAWYQDYTNKKALGKFTAISFPTEIDEGRASARGKRENVWIINYIKQIFHAFFFISEIIHPR